MRRLGLIILVAVLATLLVSIATLTAGAQTTSSTSASQGTFTGVAPSDPERRAAVLDMAEEESLPDYSQVVDNAQDWRFDAPGWKQGGSDVWAHKGNYAAAGTSTSDARFKLKTPTDGDYALYAWWPAREGNSRAVRFGVQAASGTKWVEVDQTRFGGTWVKLGTFEMKAGDGYVVSVSPRDGSGEVIADAVALVRGAASPPPDDLAPAEGGAGENVYGAASTVSERREVIRQGRKHLGTPYYSSPPASCWAYRKEDCSCFTKLVFRHFGKELPDSPVEQYWQKNGRQQTRKWVARSDLKRGDLVFFKEAGRNRPITHVAMYSGNGYVLHASNYFGKVVEGKMKYLEGYYGARRVQKLN